MTQSTLNQPTQIPTIQLMSNPSGELYDRLIKERNLEAIQNLGYADGLNGRVPIDPQFSFYYSEWARGFAEFIVIITSNNLDCIKPTPFDPEPLKIPEIDELNREREDDSFVDFEEGLFYPANDSNQEPIPLCNLRVNDNTNSEDDDDPVVFSVTRSELIESIDNFLYDRSIEDDEEPDDGSLYDLWCSALGYLVENFCNHPEQYLNSHELDSCFPMSAEAWLKEQELSIPLPHTIR